MYLSRVWKGKGVTGPDKSIFNNLHSFDYGGDYNTPTW